MQALCSVAPCFLCPPSTHWLYYYLGAVELCLSPLALKPRFLSPSPCDWKFKRANQRKSSGSLIHSPGYQESKSKKKKNKLSTLMTFLMLSAMLPVFRSLSPNCSLQDIHKLPWKHYKNVMLFVFSIKRQTHYGNISFLFEDVLWHWTI